MILLESVPIPSSRSYMPSTLIALEPLASLLAAYRLTLALQLGRQVGWEGKTTTSSESAHQRAVNITIHVVPPPYLLR